MDTENGRELKKGVVPVFAAGTYKVREMVTVNGEKITLAQYANRMNVKLLRPADFNEKLRVQGIDKHLTVQRICKACKDEKEVRQVFDEVWNEPAKVQAILAEALNVNQNLFEFEQALVS